MTNMTENGNALYRQVREQNGAKYTSNVAPYLFGLMTQFIGLKFQLQYTGWPKKVRHYD